MKYIMFEQQIGEVRRKIPIIFPDILSHSDMAMAITALIASTQNSIARVVSAGEFNNLMCDYTIGQSITLNIKSNSKDADIINNYDYLHGIE